MSSAYRRNNEIINSQQLYIHEHVTFTQDGTDVVPKVHILLSILAVSNYCVGRKGSLFFDSMGTRTISVIQQIIPEMYT